jgi:hypothetical protein
MRNRCAATNQSRKPCRPYARGDTPFCGYHNPAPQPTSLPLRQLHPRHHKNYWAAVPAPLPVAELERLRRAVGYQPKESKEATR